MHNIHVLQVDARVFEEGVITLGCIIRDQEKVITLAACKLEVVSVELVVAETMEFRWGLLLAKDLILEKIILQSDALVAVDCINSCLKHAVLEPLATYWRLLLSNFNVSCYVRQYKFKL